MAMMGKDSQESAQRDLEEALQVAKKAWKGAEMPSISGNSYDTSKVAIALLACKVLDIYGNHERH